jgi:hypothetical protein
VDKIAPYWKSVVGFVAPGAVLLTAAVQDGSKAGEHISQGEWVTAICACVITAAGVFLTPNRDPSATHQDQSVQPPSA